MLVNASGSKVGAVGTPLPGSAQIALLRYDLIQGELAKDEQGVYLPCSANELGLLISKVGAGELSETRDSRILRNVFSTGDSWYSSKSLLKRDEDGDFWFVERLGDVVTSPAGTLLCYPVEELLYEAPALALAAVYGIPRSEADDGAVQLVAAIVLREGMSLSAADLSERFQSLDMHQWPQKVFIVSAMELNDGYRPVKSILRQAKGAPAQLLTSYSLESGAYRLDK